MQILHRVVKLLWIMIILCIVSFIICDEKWINIKIENNRIVFNKIEKKEIAEPIAEVNEWPVLYKDSDMIRIFPWFDNLDALSKSDWMDPEYLAKIERERQEKEEQKKSQVYTWPSFINVNKDGVTSIFSSSDNEVNNSIESTWTVNNDIISENNEVLITSWNEIWLENDINSEDITKEQTIWEVVVQQSWRAQWEPMKVSVERFVWTIHWLNMKSWTSIVKVEEENWEGDNLEDNYLDLDDETVIDGNTVDTWDYVEPIVYVSVEKYEWKYHKLSLKNWKEIEIPKVSVERYNRKRVHMLWLKDWKKIEHEFNVVEWNNIETNSGEDRLSDEMIDTLLVDEDIDINSLESENDEFLQKIFLETKDTDVMNVIVENYLNEYQFIKAKKFLENLPDMYKKDLKPSLNLRLMFNSFALSSKTTNDTLTNLIQEYQANNQIIEEERLWYLWVIALMQQDYTRFFELAAWFTSERYKSFATKLQWYQDQIAKQMWMPDYYFDTLVSLELFNQGLFQPSKVLALSSLQQNPEYILPYQVLAYANFLTNSWDTSIEYLKKLVDLDPNNAEKYRFLMWIAYYRDEKYEQSVLMLSMIKDEQLRLDSERYLISDYLALNQENKLISSWSKLLWYDNLVSSDFYTYFYEVFYRPYSEWWKFELFAFDTELADKMIRVCNIRLTEKDRVICTYWTIWKNIALWKFDWLEQSLLNLTTEYPQWYLYHALGEYYVKQWDMEKAKLYLLKAVSLAQKRTEITQIKSLLQNAVSEN